jgi:hypothetical protein
MRHVAGSRTPPTRCRCTGPLSQDGKRRAREGERRHGDRARALVGDRAAQGRGRHLDRHRGGARRARREAARWRPHHGPTPHRADRLHPATGRQAAAQDGTTGFARRPSSVVDGLRDAITAADTETTSDARHTENRGPGVGPSHCRADPTRWTCGALRRTERKKT